METAKRTAYATALSLAAALATPAAFAQQAGDRHAPTGSNTRDLGGHTFIPSQLVAAPFLATSVGTLTGFGYANARAEGQGPNGGTLDLHLAAASLGFDFQIGLTSWWAVRVSGAGQVVSGVTTDSALSVGAIVGYDARVGTSFSWAYADRVRMGFAVDLGYRPNYNLNIADALKEVEAQLTAAINTAVMTGRPPMLPSLSSLNLQRVLTNSQRLQLGGAWQAAVALHRSLGLFVDLRYSHIFTQSNNDKTTVGEFSGGVGLSFDLHAISPIPFGFLGSYRATAEADAQPEVIHDVSAGFFYTGRRNLLLGAEATMNFTPTAPGTRLFIVEGQLILRYYW